MELPERETSRLRFGRISTAGATYFITICTKRRVPLLTRDPNGNAVSTAVQSMHTAGDIELLAATVMPDHVHLLLSLGPRLRVGQVMGKVKTLSRNQSKAVWHWQDDGFEHQLRDYESIEDYGFYIFMNPYRAGLCPLAALWPWWLCLQPSSFGFLTKLDSGQTVPQEWLGLYEEIAAAITSGDCSPARRPATALHKQCLRPPTSSAPP